MSTFEAMMINVAGITEAFVQKFITEVSTKYEIDREELVEMWKNLPTPSEMASIPSSTKNKKKKTKGKRAPTAYQNFSNTIRPQLREENPDASFGDISTLLSKIWASKTAEEKAAYKTAQQAPPPPPPPTEDTDNEEEPIIEEEEEEAPPPKKSTKTRRKKEDVPPPDSIPEDAHDRWGELNEMSAAELRSLCKERGTQSSIRRMDMIKSIIAAEFDDNDTDED